MDIYRIQAALERGNFRVSNHADEELENDGLSFYETKESVQHGEVIEDYPLDRPFPSCLIYGTTGTGTRIHSVWGYSEGKSTAILVTVYRPDPAKWEEDFRKRKTK